jgi:hypothetical protein
MDLPFGGARVRAERVERSLVEQKRDTLVAELFRSAGAFAFFPEKLLEPVNRLALACAKAGLHGKPLDADADEALARIAWPTPFDTVAPFLRALAAGKRPPVPAGLPEELTDLLTQALEAARQARPS